MFDKNKSDKEVKRIIDKFFKENIKWEGAISFVEKEWGDFKSNEM